MTTSPTDKDTFPRMSSFSLLDPSTSMASLRIQKETVVADQSSSYLYTIHRIYLCGHPDEYVIIDRVPGSTPLLILHTIVPRPQLIEGRTVKPYKQTRQRCASCAETHRASARHPRSLAAHQSQKQGDSTDCKDGFSHVLKRERFLGKDETRIRWPDEQEEDPGHVEYCYLKNLYENDKSDGTGGIHAAIPLRERAGRRIFQGPKRVGKGKLVYIVQTAVNSVLAQGLGHEEFDADEPEKMQQQVHGMQLSNENTQGDSNTIPPEQEETQIVIETNKQRDQSIEPPLQKNTQKDTQVPPPRVPSQSERRSHTPLLGPVRAVALPNAHVDAKEAEEVARNRALALQLLEGRTPTSPERHSDTLPLAPQHQSPGRDTCTQEKVPSYISHQRPFGPTRPSGGTTLSYGDQPRCYDGRPPDRSTRPEVSISNIMETLFPPEYSVDDQNEEGEEEEVRSQDSHESFRSLESQRHAGPGARSQGSRGSISSSDSQGFSRSWGWKSKGSFGRQ